MPTQAASSSSFVGRQAQLASLAQRQKAASQGEGSVVLVAGEAGAGKTRLLSEFCSSINLIDTYLAVGHCLEYIQVPYAPFLEIVGSLVTTAPDVLATAPHIAEALSNLIPELRTSRQQTQEPRPAEVLDKLRQFDLIVQAIRRFGHDRPAIVVIEDLHWADAGTLELLQHVTATLASSRILLVITFRSDELPREHPLRSTLAKLERNRPFFRIDLPPLSRGQTHTLLMHRLGPSDVIPGPAVDAICAQAEGNPLFAEELLKAALLGVDVAGGRPPATVQEAVLDRLRHTSPADTATLACAAVIGRRFEPDVLAKISEQSLEQIVPTLKRSIGLGLLAEESNGKVRYSFRHELQRQAILSELLAVEAQNIHRKIATLLEADAPEEHTVELAHHWWAARDFGKAAKYNERAGDQASSVFANRDAVVNYERALDVADDLMSTARLQLKLAKALSQCGFGERAKAAAEAALHVYEERQAREDAGQTCIWLSCLSTDLGDWLGAERYASRALQIVDANPASPVFFSAHTELLGIAASTSWELEKARPHLDAAQQFTGEPPPEEMISFLEVMAAIEACTGRPDAALARIHNAAGLAECTCSLQKVIALWSNFGGGMDQIGESAIGLRALETAFKVIRDNEVSGLIAAWSFVHGAHAKLRSGRLAEAVEFIDEALAAGIEMPAFRLAIAQVAIPLGLLLDLNKLVERCADSALVEYGLRSSLFRTIACLAPFAELAAARGDADSARLLIRRALDALDALHTRPGPGDADELFFAAGRLGDDGDVERARAHLEQVVKSSNVRATPAYLALVEAYQAAHQEKREDTKSADDRRSVKLAEHAAQLFRDLGWPLLEAQALELAGKEHEALQLYRNASDAFDVRRLEAWLAAHRRGRAPTELTAREQEILGLLVAGKSNRAIAQTLVISERTVENHVSSVLAKYGVGSRAELIATNRAKVQA